MKKVPTLINERIKYIYIEFLNGVHNSTFSEEQNT